MLLILKDEEDAFLSKYKKLNEAVVGVIEDYSLVSFIPLHVEVCYTPVVFPLMQGGPIKLGDFLTRAVALLNEG